jgi:plasmid stabilization system protein ParE
MKIVIRRKAADDLERIFSWIAADNPAAARVVTRRLRNRIARLGTPGLEHMGRPGLIENTRELVDPPYIIVYKLDQERAAVEIVAIFHAAQHRAPPTP